MTNISKGNLKKNWNASYCPVKTTYETENISNRVNLINMLTYEFLLEIIQDHIDTSVSFETLEIGCGGARVSVFLRTIIGAETTVADTSEEARRLAGANFIKAGVSGTILDEDACNMSFPDNTFDVTMSFGLLEHFDDINSPIQEAVRVLKPGGLFLHSIIPKKFSLMTISNIWNFFARFVNHLLNRRFENIIQNSRRNFPHFENNYSKKRYLESMVKAGLTECSITGVSLWVDALLPKKVEQTLAGLFKRHPNLLKSFDRSPSVLTDILGPEYLAIGVKAKQ